MFWAAFVENSRARLVSIDGDPDSRRGDVTTQIIKLLYEVFLPDIAQPGDDFVRDNAPVHTAWIIQRTLDYLVEVMVWPPYSSYISPTENLLALMKQEI